MNIVFPINKEKYQDFKNGMAYPNDEYLVYIMQYAIEKMG